MKASDLLVPPADVTDITHKWDWHLMEFSQHYEPTLQAARDWLRDVAPDHHRVYANTLYISPEATAFLRTDGGKAIVKLHYESK